MFMIENNKLPFEILQDQFPQFDQYNFNVFTFGKNIIKIQIMNTQSQEKKNSKCRVKVAIRVRPMIHKQIAQNQSICVDFKSNNQIILGPDRSYKFDRVFKDTSHQNQVYVQCVRQLVLGCFQGYNAAILAYGQTGSGKTFTMGTSANTLQNQSTKGIVPRVISEIFNQMQKRSKKAEFVVKASFLQIYNEEIKDLLSQNSLKSIKHKDTNINIREQKDGSVSIYGVTEEKVTTPQQMTRLLQKGGYNRTTAATLMNDASSRSHAIFTIFIQQHLIEDLYKTQNKEQTQNQEGFMTAKFFFVDLAGSERAKKTGATGVTLKQGININLGLLQLGNVISALSTIQKKQDQFITYRNSKLTRILQDCLGGNSNTYMIACCSPAQSNFQESLNTLKYASKAMNIKNKPVVNRDPQSALITQLKQRIFQVQIQNRKLKQVLSKQGTGVAQNIQFLESQDSLSAQLKELRTKLSQLQKKYQQLNEQQKQNKRRMNQLQIKNYQLRREKDQWQLGIQQVMKLHPDVNWQMFKKQSQKEQSLSLLQKYQQQIANLQIQLSDKDKLFFQLQKEYKKMESNSKNDEQLLLKKNKQIYLLTKQITGLERKINKIESEPQTQKLQKYEKQIQQGMTQLQLSELPQQLQNDSQLKNHQIDMKRQTQIAETQIIEVQNYIKQKQKYLQQMTKKQINLQYQLISQMKEQYHQKISLLEKQKKHLMKQKDEVISNNEKGKFVSKIDNLQTELKQYRRKVKQQKNMEKTLSTQFNQLKDLANQIKKFKVQKIQLNQKLKQDKQNYSKLKQQRIKELLNAKKQNLKKQNQIRKITIESQKKTQQNKKKEEELKRVKRVNETLKNFMKQPVKKQTKKDLTASTTLGDKTLNEKQANYQIKQIFKKILNEIDYQKTLIKYNNKTSQMENDLDLLLNDEAMFKLKLQRIKISLKEDVTQEEMAEKDQIQINLSQIHERVINSQESLNYFRLKQENLLNEKVQYFQIDTQILYNKKFQVLQNIRTFNKCLFEAIRNILQQNYQLVESKEHIAEEVQRLNKVIQQLRDQIITMNTQYQNNLSKFRQEMMMREYNYNNNEEDVVYNPVNYKKMQEKQKKSLQRKIVELTKSNRQFSQEIQMWKRKCSVVQQKYQNMKNLMSKDKNIGRQEDNLSKQKKLTKNTSLMLDQVNQMLENFDKMKKVNSSIQDNEKQRKQQKIPDILDFSVNKWECLGKIDAHNSSILSMTSHANILISTGTKSLKIWDLETSKIISDLSGPHLSGFVKFVMVDPERRLMFTACQKNVTIWDLITLNVQGTLKAHKDEVRTMHIYNDLLFTGGKGLANSGSLLVWDLRNLNPNVPMQEKQKNQDIFTFTSHSNTLYYGTRNHHVRRMNLQNMEILSPFQPPHMDSVTGLAIVKDKLISGSKDKNLRLWSLDQCINNAKHTFPAFNDYITVCESDKQLPLFYAGSRDGQIKVGTVKNDKIQLIGGILAHTQSVNAICPLEQNGNKIVTASADKTIKLWQPTKQTIQGIQHQFI